jgi:isopentenyl diphosphate isomerase/L-lactate dehydrogenase-like FMN-dependent dehydrogenase
MSALPPKADIAERNHHVRFVPKQTFPKVVDCGNADVLFDGGVQCRTHILKAISLGR